MKLSVVVSVFNEEKNIKDCLESVKDLADEIIVVDNSSSDKTGEIAKKFTKKIFTQDNNPKKIDIQKNFGFSKATGDWILSLDADERVTKELAEEIGSRIKNQEPSINGFWISRKNIIFGKWIQSEMWFPDYQLKIFRKGEGKFEKNSVHQALTVNGETEKLTNPLIHYNYYSISQFVTKLNNYTDIEAESLLKSDYNFNWLDALRFPVNDFVKTFFLQKGYKDGLHGLVLSLLQAFYMEVVFAKLWEHKGFEEPDDPQFIQKVKEEFNDAKHKFKYWFITSLINDSKNPIKKILFKASRKATLRKIKT